MKKICLLLVAVMTTSIVATAQEKVFSVNSAGDIMPKAKYVENFCNGSYDNITPYTLMCSRTVGVSNPYTINGLKYKGWEYNEPGDFNVIEIKYGGNSILSVRDDGGWDKMSIDYGDYTSSFCGIEDLDNNTFAAIFKGIDIASQPPYLTIIVMKDGKACIVYNKPMIINSIKANADGSKTFNLQENVVEWIYENTPANSPITHTMTIKDGNIYFK